MAGESIEVRGKGGCKEGHVQLDASACKPIDRFRGVDGQVSLFERRHGEFGFAHKSVGLAVHADQACHGVILAGPMSRWIVVQSIGT